VTEQQQPQPEVEPGYWAESRSLSVGLVSIMPLVVLYHWGIVQRGYGVRNLAQVWLEGPLHLVGLEAAHVLNVALAVAILAALWRSDRSGRFSLLVVAVMVCEAGFYAAALLRGGALLTDYLLRGASRVLFAVGVTGLAPVWLALGAGVYEELFFRLLVLGGGALLMRKVFLWNRTWSVAVALVVSSLLFSAVHHLGPLGEPFQLYNFTFRAVCGALLGVIFLARGLGVAVWTHALYNLMALLWSGPAAGG